MGAGAAHAVGFLVLDEGSDLFEGFGDGDAGTAVGVLAGLY